MPDTNSTCLYAASTGQARGWRFKNLGIKRGEQPKGFTADVSCGNILCALPEHTILRPWASIKPNLPWNSLASQLAALEIDESFDLPEYSHDSASLSRLRRGIMQSYGAKDVLFLIRRLPGSGVKIIRIGTSGTIFWGGRAEIRSVKSYPKYRDGRNRGRSAGGIFLGMLWGVSDDSSYRPMVKRCMVKGCCFPRFAKGSRFCRQHSMEPGIYGDTMDRNDYIPSDKSPVPKLYVRRMWEEKDQWRYTRYFRGGFFRMADEKISDAYWREFVEPEL